MMDHDKVLKIANNMIAHGGSFVQALGEALLRADPHNVTKIRLAFPEYWERYKNWKRSPDKED